MLTCAKYAATLCSCRFGSTIRVANNLSIVVYYALCLSNSRFSPPFQEASALRLISP